MSSAQYQVRTTQPEDFDGIIEIGRKVYPSSPSWSPQQLQSHLKQFPEGQLVAQEAASGQVVGMAASLIVTWEDYERRDTWRDFTDSGMFTNHNPQGGTLYGAEVMVDPDLQGQGLGSLLYEVRFRLAERLRLRRIRAGSRLRGYSRYSEEMSPEEYVRAVVRGQLWDPTLSFQLRRGFQVLDIVSDYLQNDPESLGFAALIEWINKEVASPADYQGRPSRF